MAITNIQDPSATSQVHTDMVLTRFAIDYPTPEFIGRRLFRDAFDADESGKYPMYFNKDVVREVDDTFGPSAEANEIDYGFSRDNYTVDPYALKSFISDMIRKKATDPDARQFLEAQNRIAQIEKTLGIRHEKITSTLLTTTANYASGFTVDLDSVAGDNFDDTAKGPKVLKGHIRDISNETGIPSTDLKMVVAGDAWIEMLGDANFQPALAASPLNSREGIRQLLELKEIIVAESTYNTADKGQTASMSAFWPSNSILLVADGAAPTGTTFWWNGLDGAQQGHIVQTWRDPNNRGGGGDWYQVTKWFGAKLTGVNESSKIVSGKYLRNVYNAI